MDRIDTIVDVISRFLNKDAPDDQFEAVGRAGLRETVSRYVESGEKMEFVFPGFPFKSTSTKKVLGKLPDLAEEILLSRLEALASTVSEHHPAGAAVRIVSDGIVYQGRFRRCFVIRRVLI
jgi:pyoverdine/dityrosine biosynthesis protein Dit1